jgi:hypothetical protein
MLQYESANVAYTGPTGVGVGAVERSARKDNAASNSNLFVNLYVPPYIRIVVRGEDGR